MHALYDELAARMIHDHHIPEGKIGLRHMYTRGALYKNFKVSVLAKNEPELTISNKELKATR